MSDRKPGEELSKKSTEELAAMAARLWQLAKIDDAMITLAQDADHPGAGQPWYAWAPNGGTDSYGRYDGYGGKSNDPEKAVRLALLAVAEDLPDWEPS